MTDAPRRPRAFRIDAPGVHFATEETSAPLGTRAVVTPSDEPDEVFEIAPPRPPRRFPWKTILLGAVGGLISLSLGLALDRLITDLWSRAPWLGWSGLALLGLAGLALLAILIREVAGTLRLARVEHLRAKIAEALLGDDRRAAPGLVDALDGLAAARPENARARAALAGHRAEVVEGRDLLSLAERELMGPLDATARTLILEAAKRVSVVTAISPRAIVDIAYVAWENLRLTRALADLYGGRPGTVGFVRLLGRILTHLGITGGMALGDTLVQQLVGQGLAARLSARLGEGVVNGLLTARLGLAALEIVRPMPWHALTRPSLGDMMSELARPSAAPKEPSA